MQLKWGLVAVGITAAMGIGCNKNGFKSAGTNTEGSSITLTPPPSPSPSPTPMPSPSPVSVATIFDVYAVADMAGKIQAYQDLQFKFKIPGATAGATYSATGLPTWLNIDSANGELTGVPLTPETTANFTVSVNGVAKGPYSIEVAGNPLKQAQWHLRNTGQAAFAASAGTAGEDIHLSGTIRDRILGNDIRVAISDTGVFEAHRGLKGNYLSVGSRNYLNDFAKTMTWNGSATPDTADPVNAHGTGVAGLIAERGWNNIGGRGVAPFARIAGFLFIQAQDALARAGLISMAFVDQYQGDFDVFNYSWGDAQCALTEYPQILRDRLKLTATNGRAGKGAVMVKAAGNEFIGPLQDCFPNQPATAFYLGNSNFSEDTSSPYLITVGALNADGISSSYSTPGSSLWIAAPGGEYGWNTSVNNNTLQLEPALVTTDFVGSALGIKTLSAGRSTFNTSAATNPLFEHTSTFNGTSGAAPIVTGAIALLYSSNPNLSARDVKFILASTADKVHANVPAATHPQAASNLAGHVYEQPWITNAAGFHFHNWYGFGRINVDAAVAMAKSYVSQLGTQKETNNGATWKYDSGNLNNLAVPAASATGVTRVLNVTETWKVEAIEVRVSANQCIGALGIELTSPSGTKSILMNINSFLPDTMMDSHIFVSNAFYGENSAGAWTIKLIGGRANCTTMFQNWQLNVIGH